MEGFESVQEFFCSMHCSRCHELLKPAGISLIREEDQFFVVKISCIDCNQPVGLAIVGISPHEVSTEKLLPAPAKDKSINPQPELPPIGYDEVIEAHKFFSSLGPDWMKHLTKHHNVEVPDLLEED